MPFPFCWPLSSFSVSAAAVLVPVCGASGRAAAALVWGSLIIDSASAASGQNPKRKLKNTKNKNNLQYAFFLLLFAFLVVALAALGTTMEPLECGSIKNCGV